MEIGSTGMNLCDSPAESVSRLLHNGNNFNSDSDTMRTSAVVQHTHDYPLVQIDRSPRPREKTCSCRCIMFYGWELFVMILISVLAFLFVLSNTYRFSQNSTISGIVDGVRNLEIGSITDKCNQATQTHGLKETTQSFKIPNVGDKSPGNGYWRQQLEHIVAHLKEFTGKDVEFRDKLSYPKLGKMVSGSADVDEEGIFSICIDFALIPDSGATEAPPDPIRARYMDAVEEKSKRAAYARHGRHYSMDSVRNTSRSLNPADNSKNETARKSRSASGKRPAPTKPAISKESEELLKELESPERDLEEVHRLLEEGADPNCKSDKGIPPIGMAVKNLFFEAVGPLKEAGANLNSKYGQNGNSALHEAVLLGPTAKNLIQSLLNNGADAQLKNGRGQTPQDLAMKNQHEEIADLLAAHVSHKILTQTTQ